MRHVLWFSVGFLMSTFLACSDEPKQPGEWDIPPIEDVSDGEDIEQVDPPEDDFEVVEGPAHRFLYGPEMKNASGGSCLFDCYLQADSREAMKLSVLFQNHENKPLEGRAIEWTVEEGLGDLASFTARYSYTDERGIAEATLRPRGMEGSFQAVARVLQEDRVPPLAFDVTLKGDLPPVLQLRHHYLGGRHFASTELRFYDKSEVESCGEIHPDSGYLGEAFYEMGFSITESQVTVRAIPNTFPGERREWVLQTIGYDALGQPLAVGCQDGVTTTQGVTSFAEIYMTDLPPTFSGNFEVITRMDALYGLNNTTVGHLLVILTDLFTQPGELILVWACGNASGGFLGTICSMLVSGGSPTPFIGDVVVNAMNGLLLDLLSSAIGNQAQHASEVISRMLRDLHLVSYLTFSSEPYLPRSGFEGAYFESGSIDEVFTAIRFYWRDSPKCQNAGPDSYCAWDEIPLTEIYGRNPDAKPDAGIDSEFRLHLDKHVVGGMNYGPLINALLEKRILQLIFSETGNVPITSWEDFIEVLLSGNRLCLSQGNCCDSFADRYESSMLGNLVGWTGLYLACDTAFPLVGNLIRQQINQTGGEMHIGTYGDSPCASRSSSSDRRVRGYGSVSTRCTWDMSFEGQGSPFRPIQDWTGVRY